MMPILTNKNNLMPHYQLIHITNTLTIEYEENHLDIPSYNIPYAERELNNQKYIQLAGTNNNKNVYKNVYNKITYKSLHTTLNISLRRHMRNKS